VIEDRAMAMKMYPINVPQPESIAEILDKLLVVLKRTSPPWLRKALAKLSDAGTKFLDEAVSMIRTYPEVAQYGA
jgi:nitrogen fixation protein NifX